MALNVLQWNCNGVRPQVHELKHFVASAPLPYEVICLQEMFLKSGQKLSIPGYSIIRRVRQHAPKGGLAILVQSHVRYVKINGIEVNGMEIMGIALKTDTGYTTVINGYRPPHKAIDITQFDRIFVNDTTILTGDFNAKHTLWGSETEDDTGLAIEIAMDKHN